MLARWYQRGIGKFDSSKWQEMVDEAAEMNPPIPEVILIGCSEWLIEEIAKTGSNLPQTSFHVLHISQSRAIRALDRIQNFADSKTILELLLKYKFLYKEGNASIGYIRQVDLDIAEQSMIKSKLSGKKGGDTKEANRRAREQQ